MFLCVFICIFDWVMLKALGADLVLTPAAKVRRLCSIDFSTDRYLDVYMCVRACVCKLYMYI